MSKMKSLIAAAFGTAMVALVTPASAAEQLNLYNWTVYINPEILTDFTKETGIAVNLDNYGTNEEMLAKIQAGARGSGLWNMPPHPEVSKADAAVMARYILTVKN